MSGWIRNHVHWVLSALTLTTGVGCAATQALTGGVDSANSAVSGAKSSADTSKQLGGGLLDSAKKGLGKKDGEGEGAGAGGGEKKEDEDGKRLQSRTTKNNQPVIDELNVPKDDLEDWKTYDLSNIPLGRFVTFELNWDQQAAELNLDVYDQTGKQVVQSPGRSGVPQKNIPLKVETPGVYYAHIYATGKKDATVYTVLLRTSKTAVIAKPVAVGGKGGDGGAAGAGGNGGGAATAAAPAGAAAAPAGAPGAAAAAPGAPAAFPGAPAAFPGAPGAFPGAPAGYPGAPGAFPGAPGGYPGAPGTAPGGAASGAAQADGGKDAKLPEGAIVGKIVNAFRGEDGKMILYLNQGNKAKLRVNTTGKILVGTEGNEVLDGATFTITKVIDENKSVATLDYTKSLGKNNRFMIPKPK